MKLDVLKNQKVIIDTCILYAGKDCIKVTFDDAKKLFLEPIFNHFNNILIHEAVLWELDNYASEWSMNVLEFIRSQKNVEIVGEKGLYGLDPKYTNIFDKISKSDAFGYKRNNKDLKFCSRQNRGEIASLAYAAYFEIPLFVTSDSGAFLAKNDLLECKKIDLYGVELGLALGYLMKPCKDDYRKLKLIYRICGAACIKRKRIPDSARDYLLSIGLIEE